MPRLKGVSYGFASLPLEGARFLALGAFRGDLESVVLVAFFRFGKIFEQAILFSYMVAYGATSLPTNSVWQLLPLAGPLGEALRQFRDPGRNL